VATPNKINSNNRERNRHRQDGDTARVFSDVRQSSSSSPANQVSEFFLSFFPYFKRSIALCKGKLITFALCMHAWRYSTRASCWFGPSRVTGLFKCILLIYLLMLELKIKIYLLIFFSYEFLPTLELELFTVEFLPTPELELFTMNFLPTPELKLFVVE